MNVPAETQLVGLIGWPVAHSISPAMFAAAFQALDLPWRYEAFAIPSEELVPRIRELQARGLRGFNVTIPHKQAIIPLLDGLHPEAQAIGAVNTVIATQEAARVRWEGTNTDAAGFARDLADWLGAPPGPGTTALILGAGGAARAAAYVLTGQGCRVLIAARDPARSQALAQAIRAAVADRSPAIQALAWDDFSRMAGDPGLIINCTPVGMWPHTDKSPWPAGIPIPRETAVYDMIYRPTETAFIRQARAAGAPARTGLGMLVRQGAAAFALWTGRAAPLEVMTATAQAALLGKDG